MKRLLIGAAVVGVALLAARGVRRSGGIDFEKMIERMPENAPRKWMLRNVNAIRKNTDRILELLESEGAAPANGPARAAA
jgi:hypothetical protein